MIAGRQKRYKRKEFRKGLSCGVVGCTRTARHQWQYPCAINTVLDGQTWVAVCDECDMRLNRTMLAAIGVPDAILEDLLHAYGLIQGDGAYG